MGTNTWSLLAMSPAEIGSHILKYAKATKPVTAQIISNPIDIVMRAT